MKDTILFQIIKKTMLTEVLTEVSGGSGGFKANKDKKGPVAEPKKVIVKKDPKKVIVKKDPKKDPKKPEPAKIKPGVEYIITPPENRKQHQMYNKASDGKWYYERWSEYDEKIESGLVLDGTVLAKLNNPKSIKKWDGKYGDEKVDKATWLRRMDSYDPSNKQNTVHPFLSNEAMTTLVTAAYWGLGILSFAVTAFLTKKFGAKGLRGLKWFVKDAKTAELATLGGLSEQGALNMRQWTEIEYATGNITKSQRRQLRAIYENRRYRRVVGTSTFLAMRSRVIQGDMTMAELITFMPTAYRENNELVKALLKYEQNVLNMYPGRKAKWTIATADYIKRTSMPEKEIEKMFAAWGWEPGIGGLGIGGLGYPKSGGQKPSGYYNFYTNTPGTSYQTSNSSTAAKTAADAKFAAAKKSAAAKAGSAAQIAKQEAMVTKGISRTFAKVKQIKNKKEVWGKYDVLNISKPKLADWEVFLGNGNRDDTKVLDFLYKLVTIKTEAKAIAEIKKFAVTNTWSRFYNLENRTIAIDEFLTQVLPYYLK